MSGMQRSFSRELGSLESLFEFMDEAAQRYRLDEDTRFAARLAAEEIFTNMVKYGGGEGSVSISVDVRARRLHIEFVHPGAIPFDVTAGGDVDVNQPIKSRSPGGIGLYLVRRVMDDVTYEHDDGVARVTLTRQLGGG
jgi:anti-sigma regulatory factor (Ser/Thr protein kinase)